MGITVHLNDSLPLSLSHALLYAVGLTCDETFLWHMQVSVNFAFASLHVFMSEKPDHVMFPRDENFSLRNPCMEVLVLYKLKLARFSVF